MITPGSSRHLKKYTSFKTAVTFLLSPKSIIGIWEPLLKNVLSLLLLELQTRKNRQMFCEGLAFRMCCISKNNKARTFFLFAIDS